MKPAHPIARLARLYGMLEQMRSVELRVAAVAVDEAIYLAAVEKASLNNVVIAGRAALSAGSNDEWHMSRVAQTLANTRIRQIAAVKQQREMKLIEAQNAHRDSQRNAEQMERVLEQIRDRGNAEEERRAQAISDDRYAARLAWTRSKDLSSSMSDD